MFNECVLFDKGFKLLACNVMIRLTRYLDTTIPNINVRIATAPDAFFTSPGRGWRVVSVFAIV